MRTYLGIDIGGTKIAGGLVGADGSVLKREQVPTGARDGGAQVLERALNLADALLAGAARSVDAIGIGAGGQIDCDRGVVVSASDVLPGWTGVDIAGAFGGRFAAPVRVDNDVNALASGEVRFGRSRGLRTVVFLALGTGVGGALVFDGRVHHGARWSAGEVGRLLVDPSETARVDLGGGRGTLEAYASGSGLLQTYRELAGVDNLRNGEEIVDEARRAPDSAAALALRRTGEWLGLGLASLANVLDPDMIVIGGGMAAIGDLLLDPARRALRARALPGPANCPVEAASLGRDASLLGAASLAFDTGDVARSG